MTSSEFQQKIKRVLITEEEIQEKSKKSASKLAKNTKANPCFS